MRIRVASLDRTHPTPNHVSDRLQRNCMWIGVSDAVIAKDDK